MTTSGYANASLGRRRFEIEYWTGLPGARFTKPVPVTFALAVASS